jgi:hypothetical protein
MMSSAGGQEQPGASDQRAHHGGDRPVHGVSVERIRGWRYQTTLFLPYLPPITVVD